MSFPDQSWQPIQETVNGLVLARLDAAKASPECSIYLAFIFSHGEGLSTEVRQTAGLLLKNSLGGGRPPPNASPAAWAALQAGLLGMLAHEIRPLRHTAGTCIAATVAMGGLPSWPALVPTLAAALAPDSPLVAVEGALDTTFKLTEEQASALEDRGGARGAAPAANDVLLPRVLALFAHGDPGVRAAAVATLNLSATSMPAFLCDAMDDYLRGLFSLAHDPSSAVRRDVCSGLVQALVMAPERLQASLPDLIEYMLGSTQDGDEGVAIESCEFWSALCEFGDDAGVLRPFLPRLLPVLLSNMVFEEHDDEVAEAEAAEESLARGREPAPGRPDEAKPFVPRSGAHGGGGEDEEDEEEEEVARWNLRRCSASALDMLATTFGDELLPIILPTIHQRLQESDWRAQEASILALGAISQGCTAGLAPHLQSMLGMLLPATASPRPMVRCIASWAVARYSRWLFEDTAGGGDGQGQPQVVTLPLLVKMLADRCLDGNVVVQKAACGSLATMVELGGETLAAPELAVICAALAAALQRYSRRTLRHAYDAVATVAEQARQALAPGSQGAATLLPPLFGRLPQLPAGDPELLPLLECLTSVVGPAGSGVEPWAEASFGKCVGLVTAAQEGIRSGAMDEEEGSQLQVCALDYLAALAEALGPSVESLVGSSPLVDLLLLSIDPSARPEVRQSAWAAVGDLARSCAPHLVPRLRELGGAAAAQLAPASITAMAMPACNNAAWASGELALRCTPDQLAPLALPLLERFAAVLAAPPAQLPRSLRENAAIALGRLGLVCPGPLGPHAVHFLAPWCSALAGVRDGEEKEHAFLGLCALLRCDGSAAISAFAPLCSALASWSKAPSPPVLAECTGLMQGLKASLQAAGQWEVALASLSPALVHKLGAVYNL